MFCSEAGLGYGGFPPAAEVVRVHSPDELRTLDLLHIVGVDARSIDLASRASGIPLAVSPLIPGATAPWIARVAGALPRGSATTGLRGAARLCRMADAALPRSAREARMLKSFGVEPLAVIPPAADAAISSADGRLFREKFGIDRFVLVDYSDGRPERNVPRILQALEKINHPAVLLAPPAGSAANDSCRALAAANPRLRVVEAERDLYSSAFGACEVFVEVSFGVRDGITVSAAAAGAKLVVNKHSGLDELFGGEAHPVEPTSWELIHHGITTALNASPSDALKKRIAVDCSPERVLAECRAAYGRLRTRS